MKNYVVELTYTALEAIKVQANYIALEKKEPANAQRWLQLVWDAVDSLESTPSRGAMAEESGYLEYEVRQLIVGGHLLLFTIDDTNRRVLIVGLRHVHRLPRPQELPHDLDKLDDMSET